jgi:hypothetical protein
MNRAPITWHWIMGHKGPSKGLDALGPKGCLIEVQLRYLFGCIIKTM